MMAKFQKVIRDYADLRLQSTKGRIEIHPKTKNPTEAWEMMKNAQTVKQLQPIALDAPMSPDQVRFVCISDTHSLTSNMSKVPAGDVLLHAGDFTRHGEKKEIENFDKFLGTLPHQHKIVIAGNHEVGWDPDIPIDSCKLNQKMQHPKLKLTNAIYLEDSGVNICGIKIYGTPWQPEFGSWAFNLPRGEPLLERWNLIPDDTDILLSHGPPLGHGDFCRSGLRAGCTELLSTVQKRVKPKFHVFGHIHEGYGITTDGQTVFINCSTCTVSYKPVNPAIIFDLPLPASHKKTLRHRTCQR